MSRTEELVLNLLRQHPDGLYGRDVVALSSGQVSLGSVYTTLERLEDAGWVSTAPENVTDPGMPVRVKHFVTQSGIGAQESACLRRAFISAPPLYPAG